MFLSLQQLFAADVEHMVRYGVQVKSFHPYIRIMSIGWESYIGDGSVHIILPDMMFVPTVAMFHGVGIYMRTITILYVVSLRKNSRAVKCLIG